MDDTDREDAEMKTKKVIKVNFFFFFCKRQKLHGMEAEARSQEDCYCTPEEECLKNHKKKKRIAANLYQC